MSQNVLEDGCHDSKNYIQILSGLEPLSKITQKLMGFFPPGFI